MELLKPINMWYDKYNNIARRTKKGEMVSDDEMVLQWMEFFSCKTQEDFETMAKQDEYMEEAVNTLFKLSADEQKRVDYEAREKAIRDDRAKLDWATKVGLEEGLAKGKAEGLAIAGKIVRLKLAGKTPEEISTACDLPLEQVKEILGE